jgi:phage terminase large subunit-like protein
MTSNAILLENTQRQIERRAEAVWVQSFLDECELWPHGRFNDQVDAAAGAFNKLLNGPGYNLDYK